MMEYISSTETYLKENTTDSKVIFPITDSYLYHIVRFMQFMIGCTGNSLTCIVILKYRTQRTPSNMLLWNIALSDVMSSLVAPSITLLNIFKVYGEIDLWEGACFIALYLSLTGKYRH